MPGSAWDRLTSLSPPAKGEPWLPALLKRNARAEYLRQLGAPQSLQDFRERVPVVSYEDLQPWIERVRSGESDVLFAGRPIAFERTSGSTAAAKLIPYSQEGLADFQRSVLPWLVRVATVHGVTGRAYFSISPATRPAESIGDLPVGLPDGAYLGPAAASVLAEVSAVPLAVAAIPDVERWRAETIRHLVAAHDLELISVWSPTFLLRLLDRIEGDPRQLWPRLRIVSCWAAGASRPFAGELAARLPHAQLQPKGLLSTETVVTVPDAEDRPELTGHGFFEFEREGRLHLEDELVCGEVYEVIATTASGLYRYRTRDFVRFDGLSRAGRPILEFTGRGSHVSDLAGEKLSEPFVESCLHDVPGFRFLAPESDGGGYVLLADSPVHADEIERRLCENPQYDYARRMGQLKELRLLVVPHLFDVFAEEQVRRGVRLGDVKPVVLGPSPLTLTLSPRDEPARGEGTRLLADQSPLPDAGSSRRGEG